MVKGRPPLFSQQRTFLHQPWLAQFCHALWKVLALLGTTVLLGAAGSMFAAWLLGGSMPADAPLEHLLAGWPMTLPTGVCLLFLAALIRLLGQWSTRASAPLDQQNRVRMLKRLHRTYSDLFTRSLEGLRWIEPQFSRKPEAIRSDADRLLRLPHQQGNDLPPGTLIQQLYTEAPGGLLLLGGSGAGKSTLLLSLAKGLVEQAQQDPTQPLPVILRLSSWAVKQPPFEDWCGEQIAQVYEVPRQVCEQWIQQERIVLLLDEFDEMGEEARAACMTAINAYHHRHLVPLVVCSRCTEYEKVAQHEQLNFQDAVMIQPISHDQVDTYLTGAGKPFDALRVTLGKNVALRELATTPLMLSVLMRTYRGTLVRGLSKKEATLRHQVWANYVRHMLEWKQSAKRYPPERYRFWLHWLAGQMRAHNQAVFYLEHLQPDWLPPELRSAYMWLAVLLPGALIGGLTGLLTAPLLITFVPTLLLQYSILSFFLGVVYSIPKVSRLAQDVQNRPRKISDHLTFKSFAVSGLLGAIWAVVFKLQRSSGGGPDNWFLQGASLVVPALSIGLSCLLLLVVLPRLAPRRSPTGTGKMRRNWWSCLRRMSVLHGQRAFLVAIVLGAGIGLSYGLSDGIGGGNDGLSYGLSYGLCYSLSYGLLSVSVSVILGAPSRGVHLAERLDWTWESLLRSLAAPKRLRTPLTLLSISFILFGLSQGLGPGLNQGWDQGLTWALGWGVSQGLSWGLSWGLVCWLLLGLFHGVSRTRVDDCGRRVFNRGIRDSFRNDVLMGIASAVLVGSASVLALGLSYELSYGLHYGLSWGVSDELSYELNYGLSTGLSQGLNNAWLFAASGGLLAGMLCGGLAVLRHYVLRLLLWHARVFPWKIQPFLADAATRILLLPLGGGYIFTHRQLSDYLADTPVEEEPTEH